MNLHTNLTLFTKNTSKWNINPNVNWETISIGENIDDLGYSNEVSDTTPKRYCARKKIIARMSLKLKNSSVKDSYDN